MGEGLLCLLEAALILLVESLAVLQLTKDNLSFLIPYLVVAALCDVGSAGGDHLIGHFDKECRHPIGGVVISTVAINHPNGIDETGNGIQHRHLEIELQYKQIITLPHTTKC